jgi:hypothetical protein
MSDFAQPALTERNCVDDRARRADVPHRLGE